MTTKLTQRAINADHNAKCKTLGICRKCEEPAATVQDGTVGVFCVGCRPAINKRSARLLRSAQRPRMTSEWGIDEDFGHLDTPRFYEYAEAVKKIIEKAKFAMSYGEMIRALGENFIERFHSDSLDYLMADGSIREVPSGSMTRYEPSSRFMPGEKGWNRNQAPIPRDTTRPFGAMDDGNIKRRVTA